MGSTVAPSPSPRHLDRLETVRPRMAKALNKIETPWRESVGQAIQRCFSLAGLTQKEAAALLERDQAQVARWISGDERPQVDAIFAVEALRGPLVIALAELAGCVDVETTITVRRRA